MRPRAKEPKRILNRRVGRTYVGFEVDNHVFAALVLQSEAQGGTGVAAALRQALGAWFKTLPTDVAEEARRRGDAVTADQMSTKEEAAKRLQERREKDRENKRRLRAGREPGNAGRVD
jgi:hypothetical protein